MSRSAQLQQASFESTTTLLCQCGCLPSIDCPWGRHAKVIVHDLTSNSGTAWAPSCHVLTQGAATAVIWHMLPGVLVAAAWNQRPLQGRQQHLNTAHLGQCGDTSCHCPIEPPN
jgi:hypothetical protein